MSRPFLSILGAMPLTRWLVTIPDLRIWCLLVVSLQSAMGCNQLSSWTTAVVFAEDYAVVFAED